MHKRVTAVVEDDIIRPREPLGLPNGSEVEVVLRPQFRTPEEIRQGAERVRELLATIREEATAYPEEWWDDFQRDLETNRLNFPVRF